MLERIIRQSHWALVLACLAIAFAPLDLRHRIRSRLLDVHGRVHGALLGRTPAGDAPSDVSPRVELLKKQVKELQEALAAAGTARQVFEVNRDFRLIPADVLPLAGAADLIPRLALARGSQDGVRRGLPVLADGVLIGQVEQVAAATCEVRLVTDPKFTIRASIAQPGGEVEGLLRGLGQGDLAFEPAILDPTAPPPVVRPGEAVHCSRASILCGVPALLGVVQRVEDDPGAPLPRARVLPACSPTGLRQVVIVQTGDGEA